MMKFGLTGLRFGGHTTTTTTAAAANYLLMVGTFLGEEWSRIFVILFLRGNVIIIIVFIGILSVMALSLL